MTGPSLARVVASIVALLVLPGSTTQQFYTPVWITASWSGGATGPAIDRIDRLPETPAAWKRQLCPPSKVILTKSAGTLSIVNRCPEFMTFYLCASKGSAQDPDELENCAQDPFDTPVSRFTLVTIDPGPDGDFFNVTLNLSIQLFYCSEETVLIGPPLVPGDPTTRARLACLGAVPRPTIVAVPRPTIAAVPRPIIAAPLAPPAPGPSRRSR